MVGDVTRRPRSGHDDDRRDVAELGGDALRAQRGATSLALASLGVLAEDDGLVGAVRAREVHRVHTRVVDQCSGDVEVTGHDAQPPTPDQRTQRDVEVRREVLVHRVELEGDDTVLREQLRQRVHRTDGGHVARTEDERDLGRADVTLVVDATHALARLLGRDARREAHLGGEAGEQRAVDQVRRVDVDDRVPALVNPDRRRRGTSGVADVAQRRGEQGEVAQRREHARAPVLGHRGAVAPDALRLRGRGRPALRGVEHGALELLEELDALVDAHRRPRRCGGAQLRDDAVDELLDAVAAHASLPFRP